MSTNINDVLIPILESANQTLRIKIYLKRKNTDGTYETDWSEIPQKRILKYGAVGQKINIISPFQSESLDYNLVLENTDGYYNNDDDAQSFFYGHYLSLTLIKITCQFESDGIDYPTSSIDAVIFMGYVNSIKINKVGESTLEIFGLDKLFKIYNFSQTDAYTTSADSPGTVINRIKSSTISSNYMFKDAITSAAWFSFPLSGRQIDNVQDITAYKNSWDGLKEIAQLINCENYIDHNGKFVFLKKIDDAVLIENNSPMFNCVFYCRGEWNERYVDWINPIEIGSWQYGLGTIPQSRTATGSTVKYDMGCESFYWTSGTGRLETYIDQWSSSLSAFTIEFWFKPSFNCGGSGTADTATTLFAINNTSNPTTLTVSNNSLWAGWGCLNGFSTTLEFGVGIDMTPNTATSTMFAKTTTANFSIGSINFIALVHDAAGISGTSDTWRVYMAPNNGTISVVCAFSGTSQTITALSGDPYDMYLVFNPNFTDDPKRIICFDNIKIFNYAKTDFSDRNTEYGLNQYTSFSLRKSNSANPGFCNIVKLASYSDGKDNIRNRIICNTTNFPPAGAYTATTIDTGVSTNASILKYGVQTYEFTNEFIPASIPAEFSATIAYLSSPKKVLIVDTLLNPYIDVFTKVNVTYFSPPMNNPFSDAFSKGFSNGFETSDYQIEIDNAAYKVLGTKHDLDKKISTLTLREI